MNGDLLKQIINKYKNRSKAYINGESHKFEFINKTNYLWQDLFRKSPTFEKLSEEDKEKFKNHLWDGQFNLPENYFKGYFNNLIRNNAGLVYDHLGVLFLNKGNENEKLNSIKELNGMIGQLAQGRGDKIDLLNFSVIMACFNLIKNPLYKSTEFTKFYLEVYDKPLPFKNNALFENYNKLKNIYNELNDYCLRYFPDFYKEQNYLIIQDIWWFYSDASYDNTDENNGNSDHITKEIISSEIKMNEGIMLKKYFQYKGFYFLDHQIVAFYNSLKTKGFVLLTGLSGTGKTKIIELFIDLLYNNSAQEYKCFIPVRPDFRDSKSLFGYYNPLKGEYQYTDLLKLIIRAKDNYNGKEENRKPYFIILDEMNLAHVEHYFAEFLSVMESGKDENGMSKEAIPLHGFTEDEINQIKAENGKEGINFPPSRLFLPPNLYIVGTVNIDETTYQFSPKVLDRAFSIEFKEVDFDNYPPETKECDLSNDNIEILFKDFTINGEYLRNYADKKVLEDAFKYLKNDHKKLLEKIWEINSLLAQYDLNFGYRTLDEIALFLFNSKYREETKQILPPLSDIEVLDLAILMKILPKLHGNRQKLMNPLIKLYNLFNPTGVISIENLNATYIRELDALGDYKLTLKKILKMLAELLERGYTSFS